MKYKLKINPKAIGDCEMEYLSPEEQKVRWEQVRKAIKNNEEPYELELEVEDSPLLGDNRYIAGCDPYDKSTTSYSFVIWDTKENKLI